MKLLLVFIFPIAMNTFAAESKKTFKGNIARKMIEALQLAEAAYSVSDDELHYEFIPTDLECRKTNGGVYSHGIDGYECFKGPEMAKNSPANAKLFFDALIKAGVYDSCGMNKCYVEATELKCSIDGSVAST